MLFTGNKIHRNCIIFFVSLSQLLTLVSCQRKEYSKEEAIRSLKVLNGDVSGFLTKAGEMEELTALRFIWDHDSLPLPFAMEKFSADQPWKPYDFNASKGKYFLDSIHPVFLKEEESREVSLLFSGPKIPEGEFILQDYQAAEISSRPDFPLKLEAELKLKGEKRMTIFHAAQVSDDLPEVVNSFIKTEDSGVSFTLRRTRKKETGTLSLLVNVEKKGFHFINADMNATIGYSSMGYYFEDIRFNMEVFSHLATGFIRYGLIDPTARDYASSFNAHSDIRLYEMPGKRLVGKLVLSKSPQGDLLDYFIRFKDGSLVPVSEYLPFLDKLLNMKI
jgi:hypothetical protein